ncbi:hypothetical protein CPB83DRAFT_894624 [Crepidotus variabilis]|uniref:N-acetyltransferase domain-containing protein n=1 Tax=Crepidotus variabilis TaxID=179855 RepID=A0A9P6JPT2_9AGAR|nr:hypothetical protein CPB83DRAFT_894624 [Crepidotus variabilis]
MAPYYFQQVKNATDEQLAYSAKLFSELMAGDTGVLALTGGEISLVAVMALSILRAGALAGGEFYTATNEEGEIIGFTLWMPPGQDMFSTEQQRSLGFQDFLSKMPEIGKEYFKTTYLAQFPGFVDEHLGPAGKKESWWMHMCFVRPEYQRQGVARALIELVHEKASNHLLACTSTSDENIAVYKAIGFTHRGTRIMPSPWGEWPIHLFSWETYAVLA